MIPQGFNHQRCIPHLSLDALLRLGCTNAIMRETKPKQIKKNGSGDEYDDLGKLATHFCCKVLLHTGLNVSWTLDPAYKSAGIIY